MLPVPMVHPAGSVREGTGGGVRSGASVVAEAGADEKIKSLRRIALENVSYYAAPGAEMSELEEHVRQRTDILDSVGNTTAAVGKGFAIASAALTALALFAAYVTFTGIDGINIFRADVLAALFVGGMIPVVFSALAMKSVGKAAMEMVQEVRRQFREIPGIMEGTAKPDYGACVDIVTKFALREMLVPALLPVAAPILVGLILGKIALGAFVSLACWGLFIGLIGLPFAAFGGL